MSETRELIEQVRQGSGAAASRLVSLHEASVRTYAAKVAPRPDLTEDIAQEAFVQALRSIDRFDLDADFTFWMRGIVRNMARRAWERVYREEKVRKDALAEYIEQLAVQEDPAEDAGRKNEYLAALRRCIEKLRGKSSELVKLHYSLGVSCKEIAKKISTTADAVKMALMRVRKNLRKCIETQIKGVELG